MFLSRVKYLANFRINTDHGVPEGLTLSSSLLAGHLVLPCETPPPGHTLPRNPAFDLWDSYERVPQRARYFIHNTLARQLIGVLNVADVGV